MIFDPEIDNIIRKTIQECKERKHQYVLLEHLLFVLIQDGSCKTVLTKCEVSISSLQNELEDFFIKKVPVEAKQFEPKQSLAFQRVLERALLHAEFSSAEELGPKDLLVSIFSEDESNAVYILKKSGASKLKILQVVTENTHQQLSEGLSQSEQKEIKALKKYASNLNLLADKFPPLIGREKELERIIHILSRKTKNNPVLVGAQGVGKTAIIEGLATKIARNDVPTKLKNRNVYSLNIGILLAGTKFRGDFESRLEQIINELRAEQGAILFIDEIHMLIGAGSTSGSTVDASNLLKPFLTEQGFSCIGSTTFEEFKRVFEKDRALARRFLKVDVEEPTINQTVKILEGIKESIEKFHGVKFRDESLKKAVELSSKYIHDRFLPDKAIDVIDEAAAAISLLGKAQYVEVADIENAVEKITLIPRQAIATEQKSVLVNLEGQLKKQIFGQDQAIAAVSSALKRSKAGLARDNRPIGCFLFTGPTGVGKTEVAKQLALIQGVELIRFDMSEYMEPHSVARLIGAPPGYVGHEQGGLLTDAVLKKPNAVVLLDEIEKAHPDLFNILLQVMDNASLTDSLGKRADFRNAVLIMTSNVGSEQYHTDAIGFGNSSVATSRKAAEKKFRPEFINRLDLIVSFNALSYIMMEDIIKKFLDELSSKLKLKEISLKYSDDVLVYLVKNGFSQKFGARESYRLIQDLISNQIADLIIEGKLTANSSAEVYLQDDRVLVRAQ